MRRNYELASRTERLLAWVIDWCYIVAPALLGLFLSMPMIMGLDRSLHTIAGLPYVLGIVASAAVALYNLAVICSTGQSLGKRRLGLQVVAVDGTDMSGIGLCWRTLCPGFLALVPVANIVGWFDGWFIFGESRRCLHDYLAGSVVVHKASLGMLEEPGVGLNPIREDELGFTRF